MELLPTYKSQIKPNDTHWNFKSSIISFRFFILFIRCVYLECRRSSNRKQKSTKCNCPLFTEWKHSKSFFVFFVLSKWGSKWFVQDFHWLHSVRATSQHRQGRLIRINLEPSVETIRANWRQLSSQTVVAAGEMSFGCSSLFGTEGFSLLLPGVGQSLVKEGFSPPHSWTSRETSRHPAKGHQKKKKKKDLSYNYLPNVGCRWKVMHLTFCIRSCKQVGPAQCKDNYVFRKKVG